MRPSATLASETAGTPFGNVDGHNYRDVDVTIANGPRGIRVEICERSGFFQGHAREDGRLRVVAIDDSLETAVRIASSQADQAGIRKDYCVQALSVAHAAAADALDDLENLNSVMPGPIDFEQIARGILFGDSAVNGHLAPVVPMIAEHLRQVWNARGAVDLAKIEPLVDDGRDSGWALL